MLPPARRSTLLASKPARSSICRRQRSYSGPAPSRLMALGCLRLACRSSSMASRRRQALDDILATIGCFFRCNSPKMASKLLPAVGRFCPHLERGHSRNRSSSWAACILASSMPAYFRPMAPVSSPPVTIKRFVSGTPRLENSWAALLGTKVASRMWPFPRTASGLSPLRMTKRLASGRFDLGGPACVKVTGTYSSRASAPDFRVTARVSSPAAMTPRPDCGTRRPANP